LEGLGVPNHEIEVAMRCCEPMMLHSQEEGVEPQLTTRGEHMGLGTTWTILSILNAFAGYQASSDNGTFEICGDDLIGLWTEAERYKYKKWIERLGLVLNEKKSFLGVRGVFCEKLIEINGVNGQGVLAEERPNQSVTIKESYPLESNLLPDARGNIYKIVGESRNWREVRELAQLKLASLPRIHGLGSGPIAFGGSGTGRVAEKTVKNKIKSFLLKGPFALSNQSGTANLKETLEPLRSRLTTEWSKGAVRYDDILVEVMREDHVKAINNIHSGKKWADWLSFSETDSKSCSKEWQANVQAMRGKKLMCHHYRAGYKQWIKDNKRSEISPENTVSMLDAIRTSPFINAKARYRLKKMEQSPRHTTKLAMWRSKITYLRTHVPVLYVSATDLKDHLALAGSQTQSGSIQKPKWEERSILPK